MIRSQQVISKSMTKTQLREIKNARFKGLLLFTYRVAGMLNRIQHIFSPKIKRSVGSYEIKF